MVVILILILTYLSLSKELRNNAIYIRFSLVSLLCLDMIMLNLVFTIWSLEGEITTFGFFAISFKSLIFQLITTNTSICLIISSMKNGCCKGLSYRLSKLYLKLALRLIDATFIFPFFFLEVFRVWFNDVFYIKISILPIEELDKLNEDMHVTLRQLNNITHNLEKVKLEHKKLEIVIDKKGALQVEVNENTKLSEEELSRLAQRVMVADTCYNTQLDKYKQLVEKDIKENMGKFSDTFKKSVDSIDSRHKKLFVFER